MRRPWPRIVICLLALAFAQGCFGPASTRVATPSNGPAISGGAASPGATASGASSSPTPISTLVASPRPSPTATAVSGAPTPTATLPAAPPGNAPTATAPRLGIDPPGTPIRPTPTATGVSSLPVGRETTIAQIQGTGTHSASVAQTVRVVNAIVTADFQHLPAQGFFVQEREPSSQEASTGIFVYQGDRATPDVKIGDEVTVVGVVREFNDRTQLDISLAASGVAIVSSGNPLPPPVELRPPASSAEAGIYFERYEGMLVDVPTAIVVGPTMRFGEFTVVRVDTGASRLFQNVEEGAGWRIVVDDEGGVRYDVAVGDTIDGIVGPLDFSFGQFKVQHLPEPRLAITALARTTPAFPAASNAEFTVASFNMENFFDAVDTPNKLDPCDRDLRGALCAERITSADYALKIIKAGQVIRDVLGGPTLIAVQEVESLDALNALVTSPDLAPLGYGTVLLEGLDPRGIDVGLLYRRDRVTFVSATQRNVCTAKDYGFGEQEERCSVLGDGTLDGHFLAARPPLVVSLTIEGPSGAFPLTAIVTHFKSRGGDDPEGRAFASRRTDEAKLVADIVNDLLATDPNAAIVTLGDFNDFADSEPLRVLTTTAPLQNLSPLVPQAERYSYIFNGLSQVLDHILVTPRLRAALIRSSFVHVNADYPYGLAGQPVPNRVSDHDLPIARFRLP